MAGDLWGVSLFLRKKKTRSKEFDAFPSYPRFTLKKEYKKFIGGGKSIKGYMNAKKSFIKQRPE